MKTTIDISDKLLREAKKLAAKKGVSLRAIIETALRGLLDSRQRPIRFKLKKGSFKGKGVQTGIQEGDWETIREKIYQGRGS